MSVIINGMKMPESCKECDLLMNCEECEGWERYCMFVGEIGYIDEIPADRRHEDCPLIELPPHGRLIDADALKGKAYDSGMWANGHDGFHQMVIDIEDVDLAPTIIEAEKEEEK